MRVRQPRNENPTDRKLGEFLWSSMTDELKAAVQEQERADIRDYFKYQDKPAKFLKEVLHENYITPDQKKVLQSVVDNPITILESANGTGKSFIMPRIGIWFYKVFPGAQVYSAAAPPEENLRKIMWGEFGNVVSKNPGIFNEDKVSLASLSIQRSPLEFVTGVTIPQAGDNATKIARFSGKHAPYLLFLIDEGDALPKVIYEAIDSCMSGGFARLVISYNPRSKSNPVYQMARSGNANVIKLTAFNHPNVQLGKEIIPGAVTRAATGRRIAEWTRPIYPGESVDNSFEVPDFMVGFEPTKTDGKTRLPKIQPGRRKIVQPEFSYMVLGEASSMASDQLINREWCEIAVERYKRWVQVHGVVPPISQNPLMGLDVAELGDDFSVGTFRYGGFVKPQIAWGGVNVTNTSRLAQLYFEQEAAEGIFVDSNGLGAGVWSNLLERGINAYRIMVQGTPTDAAKLDGEVLGEFSMIRDQMWWACREWLKDDPTAMLPDGESEEQYGLIDQLCSATYGKHPGTQKLKICSNDMMKEKLNGMSPDFATSLVLTFAPIPDDGNVGDIETENYLY